MNRPEPTDATDRDAAAGDAPTPDPSPARRGRGESDQRAPTSGPAAPLPVAAQTSGVGNGGRPALILAAHGSHQSATSGDSARAHLAALRRSGRFAQVEAVFWKESPSLRDARYLVDAETVVIVPLFMAEGYFSDRVVPRELELDGPVTRRDGQTLHYTAPVGCDERMIDVIHQRAGRAVAGERPLDALTLLVVGHGTVQNRNSERVLLEHVERLRAAGWFAAVEPAFIDSQPDLAEVAAGVAGDLVAVPLFVSDGYHTLEDIPAALGLPRHGWTSPARVGGRSVWYTSAVGGDPVMVEVIEHLADGALARTTAG